MKLPQTASAFRLICALLFAFAVPGIVRAVERGATFKRGVNISHWLSQNTANSPYGAPWFGESDVAWIAQQGFDHLRMPIDGREWLKPDGSLDEAKIAPFDKALSWARKYKLGVILDMHFLPGASFDPTDKQALVFTDQAVQARAVALWRKVAARYAKEGDDLRFEILNEPVAPEDKMLNDFTRVMLAAIRETNPTRMVYATSNRWSGFGTLESVELPADPHLALTLHFYEPFIFTHQRAGWMRCPANLPQVKFPGHVEDLSAYFSDDNFLKFATPADLTVEDLEAKFSDVERWMKKHAPSTEMYIGEFGAIAAADADSKRAYITAVRAASERRGWSWAVWEYKADFGVRDEKGSATPILEGLFTK